MLTYWALGAFWIVITTIITDYLFLLQMIPELGSSITADEAVLIPELIHAWVPVEI